MGPHSSTSNPTRSNGSKGTVLLLFHSKTGSYSLLYTDLVVSHLILNDVRTSPWFDAAGYLLNDQTGTYESNEGINVLTPQLDKWVQAYNGECTTQSKSCKRYKTLQKDLTTVQKSLKAEKDRLSAVRTQEQQLSTQLDPARVECEVVRNECEALQVQLDTLDALHQEQESRLYQDQVVVMQTETQELDELQRQIRTLQDRLRVGDGQLNVLEAGPVVAYDERAQMLLHADRLGSLPYGPTTGNGP